MKRVFAYDRVWLSCSDRVQSTGLKIQILTNWLTPSRITAGLPCLKCCLWWSVGAILCTEHQTERHLINQTFNQWGILEPTLFFLFPSSIRCSPNDHFDYLILSVLCVCFHAAGLPCYVMDMGPLASTTVLVYVMDMGPLAGTTVLVHAMDMGPLAGTSLSVMDMGPLAGTTVLVHAMDTRRGRHWPVCTSVDSNNYKIK